MFWFSGNLPQEWWLGGSVDSSSPYDGSITQVTLFSLPNPHGYLPCSGVSPLNGTVTYVTEFTDENAVKHIGTFRASWGEYHVCGRWGRYLPVLKVVSALPVHYLFVLSLPAH